MRIGVVLGAVAAIGCAQTMPMDQTPAANRDCDACPQMTVIPAGAFMMGSPETEAGRIDHEGPIRDVTISADFAVSTYEVTVGEYRAFIDATGHASATGCAVWTGVRGGAQLADKNWEDPNFPQGDDQPVVCISWTDANAYVDWLGETTGEPYRLPTEAEWEYAARGGAQTPYIFGEDPEALCAYGNVPDQSADEAIGPEQDQWKYVDCTDGYGVATSPVGSFAPNAFGLYDVHGNVWEWVEDCYYGDLAGAPTDGSAWVDPDQACLARVVRGGSLSAPVRHSRSASRFKGVFEAGEVNSGDPGFAYSNFNLGFRVAKSLN